VVSTPIANITATTSHDSASDPTTTLITSATTASCATARTPATRVGTSRPYPTTRCANSAITSSATSAIATGQPGLMLTRTRYEASTAPR